MSSVGSGRHGFVCLPLSTPCVWYPRLDALQSGAAAEETEGEGAPFPMHLRTANGKQVTLEVREAVKRAFEEAEGVPVCQQRVIMHGKQLEEGRTLESYNIQRDAEGHMVVSLRGD